MTIFVSFETELKKIEKQNNFLDDLLILKLKKVEKIAKEYSVLCELYCDTNHVLFSDYSEVKIIGAGADAVDFKLVNDTKAGDVVVTQDYGLAAMVLSKKAYAIHQSGKWYTDDNIGGMLEQRALAKKLRRATGKHHLKGPAKRTVEDDRRFEESFEKLIVYIISRAQ